MDLLKAYAQFSGELEDFWGRRENSPTSCWRLRLFGREVEFATNARDVVEKAVEHSEPLYATAPPEPDEARAPFRVTVIVTAESGNEAAVVLDELEPRVWRTGHGRWLWIEAAGWGSACVDLEAAEAQLVLKRPFALRPDLVSRLLLNTVILNLFIANGVGMLHASCLLREGKCLLLMAPHNTGKSTTAFHLVTAGYRLFTDSMVFVAGTPSQPRLLGFPVGRIKLRRDVFDEVVNQRRDVRQLATMETVRGEEKFNLDIRRLGSHLVQREVVEPRVVSLCLLSRSGDTSTQVAAAAGGVVAESVVKNSLYVDNDEVWRRNLAMVGAVVERAQHRHLIVGTDPAGIVAAVDGITWMTVSDSADLERRAPHVNAIQAPSRRRVRPRPRPAGVDTRRARFGFLRSPANPRT